MNTEELEQSTEEGQNRNTASQLGSIAGCPIGSAKTLFPVRKTDEVSVSFVSLPNKNAQSRCASISERENSGFSIFR